MRIEIGLVSHSPGWEQIIRQEGLPFRIVDLMEGTLARRIILLVVNRSLSNAEREGVESYLRGGGAIIGSARHLEGVGGTTSRRMKLEYLVSGGNDPFPSVGVLDAGVPGLIPREANVLRTQENTFGVFAGGLLGGVAVILPFDAESLVDDTRAANKSFYARRERLPAERVSLVAKGELRHLLHRAFEFLHHARGLPYVHLWYYPAGHRNLFAFRVDSDSASRTDIDDLYTVARALGVGMSWYLDVKSHEQWLDHFGAMVGQEIGIHCYEHNVYQKREANLANLARATHAVVAAGLRPEGVAAPYGIWNHGLAEAIDELGFVYSSEFSYAYDTLPLYPGSGKARYRTLQVPIHPVCIGSLRRVGYTEEQMSEYFHMIVEQKLVRSEPLFFYHHPSHHGWNVVRSLFQDVASAHIESVTMVQFARWWRRRMKYTCVLDYEDSMTAHCSTDPPGDSLADEVWLHVTTPEGKEAFTLPLPLLDLGRLAWEAARTFVPPSDIRRTREFDPRGMLAEVYATMKRRFK